MLRGAGDCIATAAIVAKAASADVIDNHAVALVKTAKPFPFLDDNAARLMPSNGAVDVSLRAFAGMFAINTADIAAADGRRHRLNQYLPMARLWNIKFLEFYSAVPGQRCPNHFTIHDTFSFIHLFSSYIQWAKWPSRSHSSRQSSAPCHRNTWPFTRRQLRSANAMRAISSSESFSCAAAKLAAILIGLPEKGIGVWPRVTAHLMQISCGEQWYWRASS